MLASTRIMIFAGGGNAALLQSPLSDYNSALVLYGWMKGLSPSETVRLFCDSVYQHLNYYEYTAASRDHLIKLGDRCALDLRSLLDEWSARGCFSHSINHPKLFVLSSIARIALIQCELKISVRRPEDYLHDTLVDGPIWPVYPEIAARLGVTGSYDFKAPYWLKQSNRPAEMLDLEQFVERSFACYAQYPKDSLEISRLAEQSELYRDLESLDGQTTAKAGKPVFPPPGLLFLAARRRQCRAVRSRSGGSAEIPDRAHRRDFHRRKLFRAAYREDADRGGLQLFRCGAGSCGNGGGSGSGARIRPVQRSLWQCVQRAPATTAVSARLCQVFATRCRVAA